MDVSGQLHVLLYPRERTLSLHWVRGYIGPRAGTVVAVRRKSLPLVGIKPLSSST